MRRLHLLLLLLASLLPASVLAQASPSAAPPAYGFAWPLGESMPRPRGASTIGAPVTLDTTPGDAWRRLHEAGLSPFERDRRAILAMAGMYRVTFDFLEVARFDPALKKPDAPYQTWGTELVLVAEDKGGLIALQHLLVMRMQEKDGTISDPIVVRHWRQEWRYQPQTLLVYLGANTWEQRSLSAAQRRGAWVQSVYQVDDSPRYAAAGRWQHSDSFSTWISEDTWRPLPRREFSVRKDYQVLEGTNRHTIVPSGWLLEENNLKLALADQGRAAGKPRQGQEGLPYLAREYGLSRYERIRDYDFAPGQEYFDRTEPFWAEVRAAWADLARKQKRFTMKGQPDQGSLFVPFFDYADKLAEGETFNKVEARAFIERTLRESYLAAPETSPKH